jgi:DNA polymerase V
MSLQIVGQAAALAKIQEFPLFITPVQAGFPSPADDFIERRLDLNQYLVSHPVATFMVRASGDSMTGAGIFPGDLLIVDTSIEPKDGMIVVAVIDGEFVLKRLIKNRNRIILAPENPAYPMTEIHDGMDFTVWGVVTHSVHTHKRHA